MAEETPESELKRLRKEQRKALEDEVFLGMTPIERAEFSSKSQRINRLEIELAACGRLRQKKALSEVKLL